VYATFLLWMLSELFERLPEVGDPDKPKLVFFFDEAHLLFTDAPQALVEKIEQVVRLIRSKGIGVYFVTQNPADVPELVLGQLGNRVQHALRAFTPRDQKAVNVAADTLRPNPKIDTARAITELAVGEALVSVLDEKGTPTITERAWIAPPASQIGPIPDADREAIRKRSLGIYGHYEQTVDRESAYEKLNARTEERRRGRWGRWREQQRRSPRVARGGEGGYRDALSKILLGSTGPRGGAAKACSKPPRRAPRVRSVPVRPRDSARCAGRNSRRRPFP
jgi:DNA helicase HerA-like ATPase